MHNSDRPSRLLRYCEAADRLGVSLRHLMYLVGRKRIRVVRIGPRSPRIEEGDLEAFIKASRED